MSFIDSIKRAFSPSFANSIGYYYSYSELPESIKNVFDTKADNTAINICARVISNTVASIPINVLQEDEKGFKQVMKEDYRYKVLHYNPNGYTTSYAFWHAMETTKQITGNSYAIIHRFPESDSIQLEFVHSKLLAKKPYFDNGFLKYTFKSNNGTKTIDAGDVIHLRRETIDGITGVNPYEVLFEEVKRTYLANKTITNYYEKDGKGRTFLKAIGLTQGDVNKHKENTNKFRKEAGGSYYDENNKVVSGSTKDFISFPSLPPNTEPITINNEQNDALYLATVENCDLKIAAYYGIPPHYLNIMQAQKNSNVQTLQLDFKSSTIQHILRSNRQELEMKLLNSEERESGMSIEYNVNAILELSSEERMRQYESLQKTARMTPNEVRRIEGMNWIENGDKPIVFDQMTTLDKIGSGKDDKDVNI